MLLSISGSLKRGWAHRLLERHSGWRKKMTKEEFSWDTFRKSSAPQKERELMIALLSEVCDEKYPENLVGREKMATERMVSDEVRPGSGDYWQCHTWRARIKLLNVGHQHGKPKVVARMRIISRTRYAGSVSSWDPFYVEEKEIELALASKTSEITCSFKSDLEQLQVRGCTYVISVLWRVLTGLGTFDADRKIEKLGKSLVNWEEK